MIRLAASGIGRHRDPVDQDRPLGRSQNTGHHADRRRFPGAVGSDKTEDLPFCDIKAQMVNRQGLSVSFGQVMYFDHHCISRTSIFNLPISPTRSS